MTMAEETHPPDEPAMSYLELQIRYEQSPPSQYANQLVVQVDQHCMFLSFYQTRPPIVLVGDTTIPTHVVAQPVASLAIPLENIAAFVDVINRQLGQMRRCSDATTP